MSAGVPYASVHGAPMTNLFLCSLPYGPGCPAGHNLPGMAHYNADRAPYLIPAGRKLARPKPGIDPATCILIIENNRAATVALSFMLSLRGYEDIRAVRSAARALTIAESFRPGLVFLDLELPDTDVLALARKLRGGLRPQATRLIALTSVAEHPARETAREAGFERYLVKPCDQVEVDRILHLPVENSA
jgi:CheY-like chemotaxis protein